MDRGKHRNSGWPRVVKVGHASVKVYRNVQRKRKKRGAYWLYVVTWVTPEGRQRQKFKDVATAMSEARLKADLLAAGRVEGASMTTGDRDELSAARAIAKEVPLLSALRDWQRIQELTSGHGIAAAELWAQHNQKSFKRIKVGDAIDQFISGKDRAGKQGERTYRSKLEPLRRFFPDAYIDGITSTELTAYLEQYQDGVTRNDLRKRAIALWRWAQKSKFIPAGTQLEIENTDRAAEKETEIGTITPAIYRKLLAHFHANHPEHLAALVLAGFCGVRADEIHGKYADRSTRQTWEDIDLARKHLNVTVAKKNTPAWRLVTIPEAAIEWLMLCPDRQGPVCVAAAMEKVRALAKKAKFKLPENCFRHSAISYKIAVTGDKAATATWAGNSVAEIDRRYRRPMTKEAGEAWFAIRRQPMKREQKT